MLVRILVPARGARSLQAALDALTFLNRVYFETHSGARDVRGAGLRYEREPPGREDWLSAPMLLERRRGDCEDLACYHAAFLQVRRGENARAVPRRVTGNVWHIVVRRADGSIDDPSVWLGMRGAA